MSRRNYFVRGAAMSAVQRTASIGYGLVALPIGLTHFGLAGFGVWLTLQSISSHLASGALGMPLAVLGAISRNPDPRDRAAILRHALRLVAGAGLTIAISLVVVLVGWPNVVDALGGDELPEGVVLRTAIVLLVGNALLLPLTTFPAALGGQGRIVAQQAYETLKVLARLVALTAVVLLDGSLLWLAIATVGADLCVGLAAGFHLLLGRGGMSLSTAAERPPERLLRSGLRFMGLQIEMGLIQNTDNLVTNAIVGASAVPILAAPQQIFRVASAVIAGAIGTPGWPALGAAYGAGDWDRVNKLHVRQVRTAVVIGGASWLVAQMTLPAIIDLWLGASFPIDHATIFWLGAYLFVFSYVSMQGVLLNAIDRTSGQFAVLGVEAIVNLVASILLARRFGVAGVAAGSVIGVALISTGGLTFAVRMATDRRVRTGAWDFLLTAMYTVVGSVSIAVLSSQGRPQVAVMAMLLALIALTLHHRRHVGHMVRLIRGAR